MISLLACLGAAGDAMAQRHAPGQTSAYDFAIAKLLADEGRPRQALEKMKRAVRQAPDEPVLRIEYAKLLLGTGQAERAIAEIDRARELAPKDRDVLAAVAEIHLADGVESAESVAIAQSALEELSRLPDPDLQAMIWLAELYMRQGDSARAADLLRDIDRRMPGNRFVTARLTEALLRGGEPEEAARLLQSMVERDPSDLRSRLALAELQRQAGQYADEVATLAATPATQRQDEGVRRRLARALERSGDVEAARAPLRALVESGAATPEDRLGYGRVLAALGENDEAEAVLRSLLDDVALLPLAVVELSWVLERSEGGEEGLDLLARAAGGLRRDGRTEDAAYVVMNRLELLINRGSWTRVVDTLHGNLDQLPEEYREIGALWLVRGLRESKRSDEALKLLDDKTLPLPAVARESEKILALEQIGRDAEARRLLGTMEASEDAERLYEAALVYHRWDALAEAVPLLERAAAASSRGRSEELYTLARVYHEAGQSGESEETLRRVLATDPDHSGALNDLGYLLAEAGRDLEEARRMTERAVLQEPANAAFVDSLGWALFRLGRLDEAQKYLERAARLSPDNPEILEHLGDVYRASGDPDAAERVYRRALEAGEADSEALERKLAALTESP